MLQRVLRVVLAVTSSVLVVPYALALMAEMMYGRPKRSAEDLLKSLHPIRVFTFTKSLLASFKIYKYAGLFLRVSQHYNSLSPEVVLKNIEYGHNNNTLDLYKPPRINQQQKTPVIIFIYGGTWSSGDKKMYSLLCCTLSHSLNALVLCPNYSIYPKGYVDDMVLDVSDVITWARLHASAYHADPNKIVLVGHSAGAHLVALTTLELSLKHLNSLSGQLVHKLQKEGEGATGTTTDLPISYVYDSTAFLDTYFTNRQEGRVNLPIIQEEGGADVSINKDDVEDVDISIINAPEIDDSTNGGGGGGGGGMSERNEQKDVSMEEEKDNGEKKEDQIKEKQDMDKKGEREDMNKSGDKNYKEEEDEEDRSSGESRRADSFVMVPDANKQDHQTYHTLQSIRLVVGLAGVYDIGEHYRIQRMQATEHTSHMTRAMYDQEHFTNFSPIHVLKHIPPTFKLPPFWLMHGDNDTTVPVSSSISFARALWHRQANSGHMSVLRGCNHYDVCLDLFDAQRKWHYSLLGELKKAFKDNDL